MQEKLIFGSVPSNRYGPDPFITPLRLYHDPFTQRKCLCFRPNVWFVTITQALTWMTEPKGSKDLNNYLPWKCEKDSYPPPACNLPNKCALSFKPPDTNVSTTRYIQLIFGKIPLHKYRQKWPLAPTWTKIMRFGRPGVR